MHKLLAQPLDWLSIRLASRTVRDCALSGEQLAQAEALVHRTDFGGGAIVEPPVGLAPGKDGRFQFTSPLVTPWPRNNTVNGRLYRAAADGSPPRAIMLVHGWNAEAGYHTLFPLLARRFQRAGFNVVIFELPYHGRRRPASARQNGPPSNFITGNLLHVALAAHQAILDARALVSWLRTQGCERIGVWGISLGAWLTGILACVEPQLALAVLMTPVVRPDRLIDEAVFCRPLRRSLNGARPDLSPLNLISRQPLLSRDNLLVVASEHDLFAPIDTIEELCRQWQDPVCWRTRHGHISVLLSAPVMKRTLRWVVARTAG